MERDGGGRPDITGTSASGAAPGPFLRHLVAHRFALTAMVDGLVWFLALAVSTWLRYETDWTQVSLGGVLALGTVAAAAQVTLGLSQGLYQGRWRFGSFEELAALVGTVLTTAGATAVVNSLGGRRLPLGAVVLAGPLALVGMAAVRYAWRLSLERLSRPAQVGLQPTLIYGAGDAAQQLVRSMMMSSRSPYLPVGAVEDDPRKQGHRLRRGVQVLGPGRELASIAQATGAEVLIVAIPSATSAQLRPIVQQGEAAGLEVRIVPPLWDAREVGVDDVRPVTIGDLLGRHELDLDIATIAGYLADRRVLVTGAGGSIGSELCRQISRFGPAELVMLDRDESGLHALQLTLDGEARGDDETVVVADIRDRERILEVFARFRPEVVFHAAALKHVPLLELHPEEALKTNVIGSRNVLDAAAAIEVDRFINISTDKAADPVNVLGRTKLLAECLTAGFAETTQGTYLSVRFGNVLGSRGSVLTTFQHQVAHGGPVTVTHPDVTRYFMTVEEAVQLVIQAGAVGEDGNVLMLDMGQPVRLAEVARRLAESAVPPVEVVYTGLRPGEKLTEVLVAFDETPRITAHPLVTRVTGHPLHPADLCSLWDGSLPATTALRECVDHLSGSARSVVAHRGVA